MYVGTSGAGTEGCDHVILVVGGIFSGKRAYVEDVLGYSDCDIADAVLDERPVVYNVQELVKREPLRSVELLEALKDKAVVVCNETGCGIVPVNKGEMEVREATGRLCILLASTAEKVVRLQCGIPVTIKG